jgi:hypothetical protein
LCPPGDTDGDQPYFMNIMCDMTQFVISTPIPSLRDHILAFYLMQEVLLKVGFYVMIVVDDRSNFKGVFKEAYTILNIRYHVIAKGNHKAPIVERFHTFLNKRMMLTTHDRGNLLDVYIPASAIAVYALNVSPIIGTDTVRSVPSVGREFKLPIEFEYSPTPSLVLNHDSAINIYLKETGRNSVFAGEVLKLLLEERRMVH